ncbi:hypothetical protein AKJ42_03575 [candidate division MSBL1 archaeon SCGC-AAA261C02]|uniref:ISXO2-like transposase domain-containing protein n=1 Tax=candidate division MSBL1 archaeon SCGC-AAA261C02 TaxID=1698272 RepID=A0A133UYC8_9EURY|nr:hypothetical protein AKJ42_03575 [candidate division MSBL1 archaeon SCGC-AAA261C02]
MVISNLIDKLRKKADGNSNSESDDSFQSFEADDFMPSERKCLEVLREVRWVDGVFCPHCRSEEVDKFGKGPKEHVQRYRCNSCNRCFNDLTGTVFERTKMKIKEWIYTGKRLLEGASMNRISKELGRSFEAIMRIRDLATNELARKILVELKGEIEVDETYESAGQKGTKCEKRPPRERGLKLRGRGTYDQDKPPILALVERGGKTILKVVRDLSNKFINEKLEEHVKEGSDIFHDNFPIYDFISNYDHHKIDKKKEGFVKGNVHTNTVEGIFSLLKSWLRTFRGVRKDNLWKPLKIFEFNFNFRDLNPLERLSNFFYYMLP